MSKRKPKKRCPSWCGKQAADITAEENETRGPAQVWQPTGRFYCSLACMKRSERRALPGMTGTPADRWRREHMTRGET